MTQQVDVIFEASDGDGGSQVINHDLETRDLNAWRVEIPRLEARTVAGKSCFVFIVQVNACLTDSSKFSLSSYLYIYLSIFISFFLCLISLSPFLSFILNFSHLFFLSCLPAPLLYLCRYVFLSPLLSPYFSLTLSNVFRSREST